MSKFEEQIKKKSAVDKLMPNVIDTKNTKETKETKETAPEVTTSKEKGSEQMESNTTVTETNILDDIKKEFQDTIKEGIQKKKKEETHTRATFVIEKELLQRFNEICKDKRGLKTILINKALEIAVREYEGFINEELEQDGNN